MNQLLLGAAIPFAIFAFFYIKRGMRTSLRILILAPLICGLSAIWAVVPDIPRLLGDKDLYFRLAHATWTNIFYFHHAIDLREADNAGYLYGVVAIAISFLWAAWHELRIIERD